MLDYLEKFGLSPHLPGAKIAQHLEARFLALDGDDSPRADNLRRMIDDALEIFNDAEECAIYKVDLALDRILEKFSDERSLQDPPITGAALNEILERKQGPQRPSVRDIPLWVNPFLEQPVNVLEFAKAAREQAQRFREIPANCAEIILAHSNRMIENWGQLMRAMFVMAGAAPVLSGINRDRSLAARL